jgi:phage terminase small subunit
MPNRPRRILLDPPRMAEVEERRKPVDTHTVGPRRSLVHQPVRVEKAIEQQRDELSAIQKKFAQEFLLDYDPFRAAKRAGASNPIYGLRWYSDPAVRREIERLKYYPAQYESRHFLFQRVVALTLQYVNEMLAADRNEIVQIRRVNCRYCWGVNNEYQFTHGEMENRLKKHQAGKTTRIFDEQGGTGFNYGREPNPDCPNCFGNGSPQPEVRFMDWRTASRAARDSVQSIQHSERYGVTIRFHNKSNTVEIILKSLSSLAQQLQVNFQDPQKMTTEDLQRTLEKMTENLEVDDPEMFKYLKDVIPDGKSND